MGGIAVMQMRKKNISLCLSALSFGFLLYVLFRPNTYVGSLLNGWAYIDIIRQMSSFFASDLCKFYLPDFLWAFSLGCGLIAIYTPKTTGVVVCALCPFLCGLTWELLQHFALLSGTGDIVDIIMYFLASALCLIINLRESKKE